MDNRQSNDVFVPSGIAASCACNSAPIDETDILHSTVTIGRELRFPIDIDSSALLHLTQNNAKSAVNSLRLTDSYRRFSSSVLKILIEDRREFHTGRVNDNNIAELVVGDIIMARTAVQSDTSTNKVAKLSYQARGSFRIVTCT